MSIRHLFPLLRRLGPVAALTLAACAPAPIYKAAPGTLAALPAQVAQSPEQYGQGDVIWGGSVISVHNFPDHSEVEILAYPLDTSQRPLPNTHGAGRFIAVYPGYVESFNFPGGALITVSGKLNGNRAGMVDQAAYVYPLVSVAQSHVWTAAELRQGHPDVHFGIGVGVGIR
ncbi:membrane protein [Dyella lipolytica]|uniref:Slp family lipoprotein n=1 Tax=Dyella lipolytica TaxID=1867835 RepID=A0ABW8J2Q1_9GAMM|nr:Slp family lipoprotein [Dyella lipolytica]GLQ45323.1 membrane protein [Dyella lipolytica]